MVVKLIVGGGFLPQHLGLVDELAGIGKLGFVAYRGIRELVFVACEVGRHEFQMFQQLADGGGRIRLAHGGAACLGV